MMRKNSKIYISGHNGMVGSSIIRLLKSEGFDNIVVRSELTTKFSPAISV